MSDDVRVRVSMVVAKVAKLADPGAIELDKDLYRELGVKSASALDLLLSLEEEFNVSIPDQQFGDARTVALLVSLIGELS